MQTSKPVLSFDEIEPYNRAIYNGRPCYILDKGDHLVNRRDLQDEKHLYLEFYDSDKDPITLHESLVNKYLREKRRFWVDFDDHLCQEH